MKFSNLTYKALQALTRIPLPGFKRVYCPDSNIGLVGMRLKDLQLAALARRIQLIAPKRSETIAVWRDGEDFPDDHKIPLHGVDPDVVSRYSLAIELEVQLDELGGLEDGNASLFARYRTVAKRAITLIAAGLDRYKPHAVLTAQGYGIEAAITRQLACRRGIPCLSFENSALKDRIIWEPISGVTVNRNISRNLFWRYEDIVDQTEVDEFCESICAVTKSKKQDEHASPDKVWQGSSERPLILFLGQVYTDSSLLFGCHPGFGTENVLATLCEWAEAQDVEVFVKLHPKEATGFAPVTDRPYNKLSLRKLKEYSRFLPFLQSPMVTVDSSNDWDTYKLIDKADLVVTINSQAGLEAAMRGKNVITCGNCFFGGIGFTTDVSSLGQLRAALDEELGKHQSDVRWRQARKFFYVFFSKYCIPRTPRSFADLLTKIVGAGYRFPF